MRSGSTIAQGKRVAPLTEVIDYRNDWVVRRFRKRFDISQRDAETIFVELLRWLWYLASIDPAEDNPEAHDIDQPLYIIDEMWHEFILFTEDYANFCDSAFGKYIHHYPKLVDTAPLHYENLGDVKTSLAALLARKRAKYNAVYDVLGRDVFVRWYLDFPRRFRVETVSQARTVAAGTASLQGVSEPPKGAERDKGDLIEEALFVNLLGALPDPSARTVTDAA